MQKDNTDLKLEKRYLSNNQYWKDTRKGRIVFIPKRIGRSNPKHIVTDNFDFSKIGEVITNAANTVNKVAKPVQEVATTVKNLVTTVKQTQTVLRQPATTKQLPPTQNYAPYVPEENYSNVRTGSATNNGSIRLFGSDIPLPFVLLTVALIVYAFYKTVLKK